MSWEDCGFHPGTINGPAKCPRQCSDCDGDHHFIVGSLGDGEEPLLGNADLLFVCKHCDATAEMITSEDEDDDDFDAPDDEENE